eukprot:gene22708-biopygen23044
MESNIKLSWSVRAVSVPTVPARRNESSYSRARRRMSKRYSDDASVGVCKNDSETWIGYKKYRVSLSLSQSSSQRSMTSSVVNGLSQMSGRASRKAGMSTDISPFLSCRNSECGAPWIRWTVSSPRRFDTYKCAWSSETSCVPSAVALPLKLSFKRGRCTHVRSMGSPSFRLRLFVQTSTWLKSSILVSSFARDRRGDPSRAWRRLSSRRSWSSACMAGLGRAGFPSSLERDEDCLAKSSLAPRAMPSLAKVDVRIISISSTSGRSSCSFSGLSFFRSLVFGHDDAAA